MSYNYQADNFMTEYKRKCPVCGKIFFASGLWVYKRGYAHNQRIYCSWHCMRSEEKTGNTISEKIRQAYRDGLNDTEIKKCLGVTQKQVDSALSRRASK